MASLNIIRFLSSPFAPCSVAPATPSNPPSAEDTSVARQRLSLQLPSYHCNYPTQRPRGLKHSAQARVRTPVPVRLQGMGGSDSLREPWRTKRESYLSSGHTTHLQVVEGAEVEDSRVGHGRRVDSDHLRSACVYAKGVCVYDFSNHAHRPRTKGRRTRHLIGRVGGQRARDVGVGPAVGWDRFLHPEP